MRPSLTCRVTAALVCFALPAAATEPPGCGDRARPWVELRSGQEVPSPIATFVDLLRTELDSRGFDLCASGEHTQPAVAAVNVAYRADAVTLGIEVHDALTAKRVSRDVDLGPIPADGRPLAIALAADELLRASWAELALRTAPPPAVPVPEQVTRLVEEAPPPATRRPASPRVELGVAFAWEQFAFGTALYGADARLGVWLARRIALEGRFGLRTAGGSVAASDGSVQTSAWSAGAGAAVTLTPLPSDPVWGIDAVVRFDVMHVTFVPTPVSPATGAVAADYALVPAAGARAWVAVFPALRIGAEAVGCAAVQGVSATDGGQRVTGVGGMGWGAGVGVWSVL
jgi:hypothetical protein